IVILIGHAITSFKQNAITKVILKIDSTTKEIVGVKGCFIVRVLIFPSSLSSDGIGQIYSYRKFWQTFWTVLELAPNDIINVALSVVVRCLCIINLLKLSAEVVV